MYSHPINEPSQSSAPTPDKDTISNSWLLWGALMASQMETCWCHTSPTVPGYWVYYPWPPPCSRMVPPRTQPFSAWSPPIPWQSWSPPVPHQCLVNIPFSTWHRIWWYAVSVFQFLLLTSLLQVQKGSLASTSSSHLIIVIYIAWSNITFPVMMSFGSLSAWYVSWMSSLLVQAKRISIDTSFKHVHGWQEFEIEGWDTSHQRCKFKSILFMVSVINLTQRQQWCSHVHSWHHNQQTCTLSSFTAFLA